MLKLPSTAVNRSSNRLVLLDSEHMLHILQQLRTTLCRLLPVDLQRGDGNTDYGE